MKEQIIHLDPHDDFNSARDKMGWAQTARVLLVWPSRGQVLSRRLDLLLLQRHASRLGAHLALISTHPAVSDNARSLGLPVFETVAASRQEGWRSPMRRPRPSPLPPGKRLNRAALRPARSNRRVRLPLWARWALRALVFAAGLGGLAALALALSPAATVTVVPASRTLQVELDLAADPEQAEVAGLTIPARRVRVEVEASGQTATTGRRDVPSQPAIGAVIFTSLDGIVTNIPAGTGVRTTSGAPARFRTVRAVTIEPRVGAAVMAEIEAVDLGPSGNVSGGQINAIDGPLGLQFAVTNPSPTTGGALSQAPAVTAADRERVQAELLTRLQAEAVSALEGQLAPGEFLAADSVALVETVAETYGASVGDQADLVPLALRVAYAGTVVDDNDARLAGLSELRARVRDGEYLEAGSERFERFPEAATDGEGRVHFTLRAVGLAAPVVNQALVRELVRGQDIPRAQLRLANALALSGLPEIAVAPAWYPRLPWMPFRIAVVVIRDGG
ncbi:MAG: hypothetical protein IT318_05880 [Anaerolineales bacterium]|nr:hypothetical protein [Anaerolineales bacterium]